MNETDINRAECVHLLPQPSWKENKVRLPSADNTVCERTNGSECFDSISSLGIQIQPCVESSLNRKRFSPLWPKPLNNLLKI